jgi:hypothetical protein
MSFNPRRFRVGHVPKFPRRVLSVDLIDFIEQISNFLRIEFNIDPVLGRGYGPRSLPFEFVIQARNDRAVLPCFDCLIEERLFR